jgi:hypothetical protein
MKCQRLKLHREVPLSPPECGHPRAGFDENDREGGSRLSTWIGWWLHDWGLPLGSVVAAGASAFAAFNSLRLSKNVAETQQRLQGRQLKQDLFDKRFQIYRDLEDVVTSSLGVTSCADRNMLPQFRRLEERATFLFPADVGAYFKNTRDRLARLMELYERATRQGPTGNPYIEPNPEILAAQGELADLLGQRERHLGKHLDIGDYSARSDSRKRVEGRRERATEK